ncbi:recombinase family protein [Demequina zhanjiangensis]|uniref:Recombinase family protein n=1 Tax=Demequina zhanjiangensis TaxID=3051659 RepID=A0ABT8G3Q3_9MICO|nr:recombinase family protein [Demequina sp. SYSU T00b26]MDN4473718.1 recombinase family protein [Demequina sp. SYSU T00b26]
MTGLMDALALLKDDEADCLIVARLDRLARQLTTQEVILAEVRKQGREVH